ncbi:MAG: SGNH/GDSL hydrolase family protein [Corynebacterium sp.]|nr:SGNH/GDSL hydrolase family protein [Corynebacterium sp.]
MSRISRACAVAAAVIVSLSSVSPAWAGPALSSNSNAPVVAPARAQEGGARVVVLGDSHTVGRNEPVYRDERGCEHSYQSWPNLLKQKLGLRDDELVNTACAGAALASGDGFWLPDEVRHAEALNALGPKTEQIFIQMGFNDLWGKGIATRENVVKKGAEFAFQCLVNPTAGCGSDPVDSALKRVYSPITTDAYVERLEPVVKYLRYYAPNAKISLVGYVELAPNGANGVCFNVLGTNVTVPVWQWARNMEHIDAAQRGAAERLNLNFVDIRSTTAGHSSCSPRPWVRGVKDPRIPGEGEHSHASLEGERVISDVILATVQ